MLRRLTILHGTGGAGQGGKQASAAHRFQNIEFRMHPSTSDPRVSPGQYLFKADSKNYGKLKGGISGLRYRQRASCLPPSLSLSLSFSFVLCRSSIFRGPSINEAVTCHFTNASPKRNIPCLLKRIDPSGRATSSADSTVRDWQVFVKSFPFPSLSVFALFPSAINVRVTSVARLRRTRARSSDVSVLSMRSRC